MILLILAVVVGAYSVLGALHSGRRDAIFGAAAWFSLFYTAFVLFGYVQHYMASEMPASGPAFDGLLVVTLGLMATQLGIAVASWKRTEPRAAIRVERWTGDRELVVMALVILVPSWLYFVLLGDVPLLTGVSAVSSGGADGLGAMQQARLARDPYVNAEARMIPLQGLLEIFRNIGTPALFAATVLRWRRNGFRRLYLIISVIALVTVMAAGQKWPLQYMLFALLIALGLATRGLPWRIVSVLGALGLLLASILSVLQGRAGSGAGGGWFLHGASSVLDRTFNGYVVTSILSYELSDPRLQSLGGATYWQSLIAYLPGLGQSFSVDFFSIVYGVDRGFTAPPDFSTELFINWGLVGVVVGGACWGFLLGRCDEWLGRGSYSPETLGLVAITILSLATVTTSGVMTSLRVIFIVLPVVFALRLGRGTRAAAGEVVVRRVH